MRDKLKIMWLALLVVTFTAIFCSCEEDYQGRENNEYKKGYQGHANTGYDPGSHYKSYHSPNGSKIYDDESAQAAYARLNELRDTGGSCYGSEGNPQRQYPGPRGEIRWNESLALAARDHLKDLLTSGTFSHEGTDGSITNQRVKRRGYMGYGSNENLAGWDNPHHGPWGGQWVDMMATSKTGHCIIQLSYFYDEVGIAVGKLGSMRIAVFVFGISTYEHFQAASKKQQIER